MAGQGGTAAFGTINVDPVRAARRLIIDKRDMMPLVVVHSRGGIERGPAVGGLAENAAREGRS